MNCPTCEVPSLTLDPLQETARCEECGGAWEVVPAMPPLYVGNLIYLPFARHLAEEEEALVAMAA